MEAKLYLERINQEMINKRNVSAVVKAIDAELAIQRADAPNWGGNVWDKSCCIINIHKNDPDIRTLPEMAQLRGLKGYIMMRREKFGALVWVRKTNAVFQLDEEAFMALNDLDNGVPIQKVAKMARASVRSIRSLLRVLDQPVSQIKTRV